MSRIYTNEKLTTLPVETHSIPHWSVENFTKIGDGILLEGLVCSRSRHVIVDAKANKYRYFVFHIKIKRAHKRKFDNAGKEITPNFSEEKKVSTGYLMSSYKKVEKGKTDKINNDQVALMIRNDQLLKVTSSKAAQGTAAFWIAEEQVEKLDIEQNDEVRLKTKGDSPFIDQLLRIDAASNTVSNMAGDEKVGASWTDKILENKSSGNTSKKTPEVEGVDEDEWDD